MPPQGRNENFEDALSKVYTQVAQLALYPDADLEFTSGLQQVIMDKLRATNQEQQMAPATPNPVAAPTPDMGMEMGGGPAPGGGGLSLTGGGPDMPNMDELARVLGSQQKVS